MAIVLARGTVNTPRVPAETIAEKEVPMPSKKITRQDLQDAAEKYKNWGKWGPNDEIGTLNYTTPEDIIGAAHGWCGKARSSRSR